MIQDIRFVKTYDLTVEKETQRRFPVKTVKPSPYGREKHPYDMFVLFRKGLRINFDKGVNVIVGENGSGKSSLISLIKSHIKNGGNCEEENHYTYININGTVTNENTIFFDGEKDNPLTAIPQMINPMDSKGFVSLSAQLFFASEESHGESMLPALDYILDNARGGYTIFMDEPETALSLGNQIRLVKKMWRSVEMGNQLIISTHSLAIINQFNTIFDMETRKWVSREKYVDNILNKS